MLLASRRSVGLAVALLAAWVPGAAVVAQSPASSSAPASPPAASPTAEPSPSIDPLRDFTHAPGTRKAPGGLDWQLLADGPRQNPTRELGQLIAWNGGFAMLESATHPGDEERPVAVWRSADGRTWDRAALPTLGGVPDALLAYRDGLVFAVVPDSGWSRSVRVDVWRSDDAVTWRRVGRIEDRVPSRLRDPWHIFAGPLVVAGNQLGLVTTLTDERGSGGFGPTGPQLAGVVALAARTPPTPDRLRGWTSSTGARWTRTKVEGIQDEHGNGTLDLPTSFPDTARALRLSEEPALIGSEDGVRWRDVAPIPADYEWGGSEGLLWSDAGTLLYGDNSTGGGCGNHLTVWRLDPAGTWTVALDRQPAAVYDGAAEASDVVLVGVSWCRYPSDDRWGWILVSSDGGRTWDPDRSWVGAPGACFSDLAIHEGVAVMLACPPAWAEEPTYSFVPAVWTATLPAPAPEATAP